MSRVIKVNPELIDGIVEEFKSSLEKCKLSDGKITFSKDFGKVDRKATLFFEEMALLKMEMLVKNFDKEVAWHGTARRGDDPSKDEYIITDILVYPQGVTGATVNTDQNEYQMWLMHQEDEVFNNIRMQGHSHVNMATNPSGVDTTLYEQILEQLEDDMFYIFLIWNKRGDKWIKIYDLAKNVMFETADITVKSIDDGSGIQAFLNDAKAAVKDKVYVNNYQRSNSPYGYWDNERKEYVRNTQPQSTQVTQVAQVNKVTETPKPEQKNSNQKVETPKKKKKKKKADEGYFSDYRGYQHRLY